MAGFAGKGTRLIMSANPIIDASTVWQGAAIGDLTNISGPTMSAEEIDISSHDTAGNFREFVVGFKDAGEISLEGNLTVGGGADDLVDAFKDRAARRFAVVFPATGTSTSISSTEGYIGAWLRWMFDGTVSGVETATPYDDKAGFSATVRISGAPALLASSGSTT